MSIESFYQLSMCAVDPDELRLDPDSFERRLRDWLPRVVSIDDFAGWYSDQRGRPPRCPVRATGMLLLQTRYGWPDKEVVRRARRDLGVRYALRLDGNMKPPGVSTLRRVRRKLRERKGDDFLHRRVLALARELGLIPDVGLQAQDSTNTDCRGAVIDTFNLIATGIGQVLRTVARALGCAAESLAKDWGLTRYLSRSIKGQVRLDWTQEDERNALLTQEIRDADRLVDLVASLDVKLPPTVDEALALLRLVARQDVEECGDGTYKIARGTAKGRIISISDPEARHGRKSSSKVINGFKTHVQGTIESQFVTGILITDAATHDASPSPELVEQSAGVGLKPGEVVADAAYGTGANIRACAERDVKVLTKQGKSSHKNCFTKREFVVDLEGMTVTCPGGHTTTEHKMVTDPEGIVEQVPQFTFPKETCGQCPLAQQCNSDTKRGRRRRVRLSAYEAEFQATKTFNQSSRAPEVLRSRSAVERLISHLVRMGMRHARFFGMHLVQYQAYLTAAAYNLQRIFTLTKWSPA